MTPEVVIGPALTIALLFFALPLSIALSVHRANRRARTHHGAVFVDIQIGALLIATVELLLNLSRSHFGDATLLATLTTFATLAYKSSDPPLPRARIYREQPKRQQGHPEGHPCIPNE